ncbi:MAG TPA: capsule assembly Wzi family protein [Bryobacteraceae bacterium]|nr:capsule assembly Wzi family protein [Bryobacteraceae bacterium]
MTSKCWPLVVGLSAIASGSAHSQVLPVSEPATANFQSGGFVRQVLGDEAHIFSSPLHIRSADLKWLVPLTGTISFLVASDRRNMQERIHTDAPARNRSLVAGDAGLGSLAAVPTVLAWWGWRHGDDYAWETGLLGARAAIDSALTTEFLREALRRERPGQGDGSGAFLHGSGLTPSFPSMHAGTAWALAEVIARRYPGPLTKVAAYSLATAVSLSRVTAKEHFPSDVAAGSALGWLIGHYVSGTARRHGRSFFDPPDTGISRAAGRDGTSTETGGPTAGSPYVPMDSWVYEALDRLAGLGMIPSQISGLRPWTRAECRRQIQEADAQLLMAKGMSTGERAEVSRLLTALENELDPGKDAGSAITVDSIYVRSGVIAGPPLNDSLHFGQTWMDDSGRPFGRGFNSYAGFTAHAESGRFFASVQAEYQHAPGSPADALPVRQEIATLDANPLPPAVGQAPTDRFRAVEASVGLQLGDFAVSLGKQELWWGPTADAPLAFSTNAEPTKNLKISTVHPFRLPGVLRYLGDIRSEFILGKLGGQKYTWRPWFNAQKISFKLTPDLELGFTRWSIFWGVGHPITLGSLVTDLTSVNSPTGASGLGRNDPGDRKGGFDFRLRIPWLRNWLTLYSDSYCDDDPSPLAAPRHAAINPGVSLTHVPGIPRLEFRMEAPSTTPMSWDDGAGFIYWNNQYHSGNTNYGHLLGNPIGRDNRAQEGWVTYHLSARDKIELGYRQLKASNLYLPGGGTQSDARARTSLMLGEGWSLSAEFQYERFWLPLLGGPQRNLSGWLQLTWEPKWRILL